MSESNCLCFDTSSRLNVCYSSILAYYEYLSGNEIIYSSKDFARAINSDASNQIIMLHIIFDSGGPWKSAWIENINKPDDVPLDIIIISNNFIRIWSIPSFSHWKNKESCGNYSTIEYTNWNELKNKTISAPSSSSYTGFYLPFDMGELFLQAKKGDKEIDAFSNQTLSFLFPKRGREIFQDDYDEDDDYNLEISSVLERTTKIETIDSYCPNIKEFTEVNPLQSLQVKLLESAEKYIKSNHQVNGLMLFMGVGMGKTKTSLRIAEKVKASRKVNKVLIFGSKDMCRNFHNEVKNSRDEIYEFKKKCSDMKAKKTENKYSEFLTLFNSDKDVSKDELIKKLSSIKNSNVYKVLNDIKKQFTEKKYIKYTEFKKLLGLDYCQTYNCESNQNWIYIKTSEIRTWEFEKDTIDTSVSEIEKQLDGLLSSSFQIIVDEVHNLINDNKLHKTIKYLSNHENCIFSTFLTATPVTKVTDLQALLTVMNEEMIDCNISCKYSHHNAHLFSCNNRVNKILMYWSMTRLITYPQEIHKRYTVKTGEKAWEQIVRLSRRISKEYLNDTFRYCFYVCRYYYKLKSDKLPFAWDYDDEKTTTGVIFNFKEFEQQNFGIFWEIVKKKDFEDSIDSHDISSKHKIIKTGKNVKFDPPILTFRMSANTVIQYESLYYRPTELKKREARLKEYQKEIDKFYQKIRKVSNDFNIQKLYGIYVPNLKQSKEISCNGFENQLIVMNKFCDKNLWQTMTFTENEYKLWFHWVFNQDVFLNNSKSKSREVYLKPSGLNWVQVKDKKQCSDDINLTYDSELSDRFEKYMEEEEDEEIMSCRILTLKEPPETSFKPSDVVSAGSYCFRPVVDIREHKDTVFYQVLKLVEEFEEKKEFPIVIHDERLALGTEFIFDALKMTYPEKCTSIAMITGDNCKIGDSLKLDQDYVIEAFENGEIDILIFSNVVKEGLNIISKSKLNRADPQKWFKKDKKILRNLDELNKVDLDVTDKLMIKFELCKTNTIYLNNDEIQRLKNLTTDNYIETRKHVFVPDKYFYFTFEYDSKKKKSLYYRRKKNPNQFPKKINFFSYFVDKTQTVSKFTNNNFLKLDLIDSECTYVYNQTNPVQHFIHMSGKWDYKSLHQATGRSIRNNSHHPVYNEDGTISHFPYGKVYVHNILLWNPHRIPGQKYNLKEDPGNEIHIYSPDEKLEETTYKKLKLTEGLVSILSSKTIL